MSDITENNAVFSGTNYAENYRKGRPIYPLSLIEAILKFLKEKVSFQCSLYYKSTFSLYSTESSAKCFVWTIVKYLFIYSTLVR